jgi:hypothetical protein
MRLGALRCLGRTAVAMARRRMPGRRRTRAHTDARPDPAVTLLATSPITSYLLEQRGRQRILWRLSENIPDDDH